MTDLRLLIDIGNSRIKWAWAQGGVLDSGRAGQGDFSELERACRPAGASRPAEVLVASVAGADRARQVAELCNVRWGIAPRILRARQEQGGVRNGYAEPEQLGVDRWLAIVGAVAAHGKPVVVWDLGTASTLDAVDGSGQHLGGWILPGPATMLDSLVRGTKLKVPPDLENAEEIEAGRSTAECIRRGILASQLGALNQFMKHVAARIGQDPKLVVAGGAAVSIAPLLDFEHVRDPWLVFRGMLVN
ncbi:type III pantothenate kinase [Pseudomonadota bacterium]|jgi:type III pantothenate kinase